MEKKRGRPRKGQGDTPIDKKFTRNEIAKRQRERYRAAGKAPMTFWIDADLAERLKEKAWAQEKTGSELVEEILIKEGI